MNFESSNLSPYGMDASMAWANYLAPVREIDPYVDLSLTAMSHGYLAPVPEKAPIQPEEDFTEADEIATGISKRVWADPVEEMLKARRGFLEKSVEDILSMLEERQDMKEDHLTKIDKESCEAKTRMFEVDGWQPAMNKEADRIRANSEKEMSGLEREKRMEEIACWRDVSRMRMELHTVLQEWSGEKRKESFLLGGGQSSP